LCLELTLHSTQADKFIDSFSRLKTTGLEFLEQNNNMQKKTKENCREQNLINRLVRYDRISACYIKAYFAHLNSVTAESIIYP